MFTRANARKSVRAPPRHRPYAIPDLCSANLREVANNLRAAAAADPAAYPQTVDEPTDTEVSKISFILILILILQEEWVDVAPHAPVEDPFIWVTDEGVALSSGQLALRHPRTQEAEDADE
jgi:hypothetical protein